MPAQLKTVKRANKDQGVCAKCKKPLPVGSAYRYYRPGFRSRTKVRVCMSATCTPLRSELETSRMADAYAAVEGAEDVISTAETVQEIESALEECAEAISEVASEYEDTISETPMLEDKLREKIDMLTDFASNLEGVSLEEPDDEPERSEFDTDEDFEAAHKKWESESEEAIADAREEASNALSELE